MASSKPYKLFVADWCKPCKKLRDNINQMEMNAELDTTRIEVLNVDTSDGNNEARKYNVRGLPTLIRVDGNGTAVDVYVGYRDIPQLKEIFSPKI